MLRRHSRGACIRLRSDRNAPPRRLVSIKLTRDRRLRRALDWEHFIPWSVLFAAIKSNLSVTSVPPEHETSSVTFSSFYKIVVPISLEILVYLYR